MPFLQRGGLFPHTEESYSPGDELFLLLRILDEPEKYAVIASVVWITPSGAQNRRKQGIGLQFGERAERLRDKIEGILAGDVDTSRQTLTL